MPLFTTARGNNQPAGVILAIAAVVLAPPPARGSAQFIRPNRPLVRFAATGLRQARVWYRDERGFGGQVQFVRPPRLAVVFRPPPFRIAAGQDRPTPGQARFGPLPHLNPIPGSASLKRVVVTPFSPRGFAGSVTLGRPAPQLDMIGARALRRVLVARRDERGTPGAYWATFRLPLQPQPPFAFRRQVFVASRAGLPVALPGQAVFVTALHHQQPALLPRQIAVLLPAGYLAVVSQ